MTQALMIAAPRSGSGKTLVTLGLMRAFSRLGLRVSGFKNGPDYIDPAFHHLSAGNVSYNLDSYAMGSNLLHLLFAQQAQTADLLIGEASMGLFDGVLEPPGRCGAAADLARLFNVPVILVLDVSGQAQTAAATVKGLIDYDKNVDIAGIILNRVASVRHQQLIDNALKELPVSVLGYLPKADHVHLPERHLGLVQAEELPRQLEKIDLIADFTARYIDLDKVLKLARQVSVPCVAPGTRSFAPPGQRIALARDRAFSFIYPHILAGWRSQGAEIIEFSPLADEYPAIDCDFCWLPGGYPELYAGQLARAQKFMHGLRNFAKSQAIHGECGGYMVLGEGLQDADGHKHKMADLLSVTTSFARRKLTLGYRRAVLTSPHRFGTKGAAFTGHEFHYATILSEGKDAPFVLARDAYKSQAIPMGQRRNTVSGSFFHLIAHKEP